MVGRRVAVGGVCKRDCGQLYNTVVNLEDHCMACQGDIRLLGYDPVGRVWMSCAESLSDLPPHEVTEEGLNAAGQRYVRLQYADGSECLIDPIPVPWDDTPTAFPITESRPCASGNSDPTASQ